MKLSEYLVKHSLTSEQFAKRIKVSVSSVNKWRIGNRTPSWPVALKVKKATKGRVKLEDWYQ